jgi:hypothetical protein
MVPAKKAYLDGELYGVGAAGLSSFAETRPRPTESAALDHAKVKRENHRLPALSIRSTVNVPFYY